MASTTVVKVKVEELTKYGFKMNGRYVNYSKQFNESDKANIVPGSEFEAEFYIADSGKEYLNKVLTFNTSKPLAKEPAIVAGASTTPVDVDRTKKIVPDSARAKPFTPKFQKKEVNDSEKMTKADWNAKDRNMMIGGRSHDAAVLVGAALAVGISVAEALKAYKEALQGLLIIAEEVK